MKDISTIADIINRQGVAIAISLIVAAFIWIFGRSFIKQYEEQKKLDRENLKAEKEIERQERKEDREAQREQTQQIIDLQARYIEALKDHDIKIDQNRSSLKDHDRMSCDGFTSIERRFDSVDSELEAIKNQVNDLPTKVMVEEMKRNIDHMRSQIKKD